MDNIYRNALRRHRNFLLGAIPEALSLAKRTENKDVRSRALKLYFDQKRSLAGYEKELGEFFK